jgi:hypothetical protein
MLLSLKVIGFEDFLSEVDFCEEQFEGFILR